MAGALLRSTLIGGIAPVLMRRLSLGETMTVADIMQAEVRVVTSDTPVSEVVVSLEPEPEGLIECSCTSS